MEGLSRWGLQRFPDLSWFNGVASWRLREEPEIGEGGGRGTGRKGKEMRCEVVAKPLKPLAYRLRRRGTLAVRDR